MQNQTCLRLVIRSSLRPPQNKFLVPISAYTYSEATRFDTTSKPSFAPNIVRLNSTMASATNFFKFSPKDKKGNPHDLSQYEGKVILAVNTASKCGFTPQYAGLEKLWKKIHEQEKYANDFVILGFPCNQFGGQDPGSNDEIQNFCQVNYGVSFPILGKTDVNGESPEPVWEWMKGEKSSMGLKRIKWNFEKFLIGRDGKVVNRWASTKSPESLEGDIMKELEKTKPEGTAKAEL